MRVAHQLARLVSDGGPRVHVAFDTEARAEPVPGGERQTFALACSRPFYLSWRQEIVHGQLQHHATAGDLWGAIVGQLRPRTRVVVWCHNLAYDLRISRGLLELPARGLALRGLALGDTTSWAAFTGAPGTLLFCDLVSWLPAPLARIGQDVGVPQPQLEHAYATDEQLRARCAADVEITARAAGELVGWCRRERLGPFKATGAGQSHSAWRRRFLRHRPFVHDSEPALQAERRAMWTGRCEAWRWGKVPAPGGFEYDLQLAYANIAASCELPHRLIGTTGPCSAARLVELARRHRVLADVQVSTDQPLAPAANGELIHWPVGTFDTVLWDPELQLLAEHGAAVKVRRAWLYQPGRALEAFSRWQLEQLHDTGGSLPAPARRALKHWARTTIGRCALRYRSWEHYATLGENDLRLGELHDLDTGEVLETLQVGDRLLTLADQQDADDSLPQITGWVMAEARRRLWLLARAAGLENVLYLDTDSLIVTEAGSDRLDLLIDRGGAFSLAMKAHHRRLEVLGPRQLILGRTRKVAGVPLTATRTGPREFTGEHWRGLAESLARREGDAVSITSHTWRLAAVDTRRDHLDGGRTAPHRVG